MTLKVKKGAQTASVKALKNAYHAPIYSQLPKLKTAVSDAKDIKKLLSGKYGFNISPDYRHRYLGFRLARTK